ncbi:non-homologous end joining protein Ku [Methylosinus sp. C49]|uniref:non-homologous end joining protein Ku n=1 Tax=Methylosinus sp. C49 TaxID=2699395 RepID=UPI001366E9DB|nr:Ku protein [Methylosinus sp. C49]BBU62265.1 non-homologous end joining protein Ku [Methylosinus sp. C49]
MAPRARAYWQGYLRLSLVSIGVELYAATSSAQATTLHQIHKPSGKRVRYEKVVPGVGPIDSADIVKGFEIGDDSYVVLEPDELDEIKLDSGKAIELVQFVGREEIDPRYFDRPYYLAPEGDVSTEGYAVIREALRRAGKIGIGRLTMRGRESIVAVTPLGKGLLVETLRYANELRAYEPYFAEIGEGESDAEMVALATELIERKSAPFDPKAFKDSYAEALRDLVERKREGQAIVTTGEEERRGPGKVIDLIEALKRSVGESATQPAHGKARAAAPTKKASAAKTASAKAAAKTGPVKKRA